jgi:hypothetical protein
MTHEIRYITDPGHGWFEVPVDLIWQLGIEQKITAYSYRRGEFAYLEEDCDAFTFDQAMKAQGLAYALKELHQEQTMIRNYPRFVA